MVMQYMLLIYSNEADWYGMKAEEMQKAYGDYMKFTKELIDSGAMRNASQLKPINTATTVRVRNGKVMTTDGPFAETKEQLGGYYLIDVPNLDEAINWASKIPSVFTGSVEVRPLQVNPAM
jgi:hypothetical protein